jgi:hypothetical protein
MTHNMPPPPLVYAQDLALLTCCPACAPPPCPHRACSTCRTASVAKLLASAAAAHHILVHVKPSSLCRAAARQKLSSVSDLRAKQRHACGGGAHDRWPFQSLRWHRRLQYGVPHAHAQNDSSPQPSHLQRSAPSAERPRQAGKQRAAQLGAHRRCLSAGKRTPLSKFNSNLACNEKFHHNGTKTKPKARAKAKPKPLRTREARRAGSGTMSC